MDVILPVVPELDHTRKRCLADTRMIARYDLWTLRARNASYFAVPGFTYMVNCTTVETDFASLGKGLDNSPFLRVV